PDPTSSRSCLNRHPVVTKRHDAAAYTFGDRRHTPPQEHHMSHRRRRFLASLVLGGLLLAGCGTAADEGSATSAPPAQSASSDTSMATATEQPLAGCEPPPPLPTDVPTFERREAPSASPADRLAATLRTNCGDVELE